MWPLPLGILSFLLFKCNICMWPLALMLNSTVLDLWSTLLWLFRRLKLGHYMYSVNLEIFKRVELDITKVMTVVRLCFCFVFCIVLYSW